nr:hypothetical protein Iba_chr12eCG10570 [Ipomoea batatas]
MEVEPQQVKRIGRILTKLSSVQYAGTDVHIQMWQRGGQEGDDVAGRINGTGSEVNSVSGGSPKRLGGEARGQQVIYLGGKMNLLTPCYVISPISGVEESEIRC